TARYILGNLYDFDPARHSVPVEDMDEMDRWALHRLQEVIGRVRKAYEQFQFHVVYHRIHNYCAVDLSALYLDVLKDRLYTSKPLSGQRRSAQTAMYIILEAIVRLLAPILTFTAEEIWKALPASEEREESVHMALFPDTDSRLLDNELGERWKTLIAVKGEISKVIEAARRDKVIGHSLDSSVRLSLSGKIGDLVEASRENLERICIVSDLSIVPKDRLGEARGSDEITGLNIAVAKAAGEKCERCWHYSETIGSEPVHPSICGRCAATLRESP
ncbi:MAG: class I tRNA ligase family protein, partial [Syntrophales bacterium]|nr:class I tRNA ligase family protein [Syntrophales bacterium]